MSKNDLSAFQRKSSSATVLTKTDVLSPKIGAPKKSSQEKLSQRIQTMITVAEFEKLEVARGAITMSAYLRLKLKETDII